MTIQRIVDDSRYPDGYLYHSKDGFTVWCASHDEAISCNLMDLFAASVEDAVKELEASVEEVLGGN